MRRLGEGRGEAFLGHHQRQDEIDHDAREGRSEETEAEVAYANQGRIEVEILSDATANSADGLVV